MSVVSRAARDGRVLGHVDETPIDDIRHIVALAEAAAPTVGSVPPRTRQRWLEAIASAVVAHRDELIELADAETALGVPRLTGELARCADQLRFYARVAVEGSYLGATIDSATATSPRLVRVARPLGPVAVFGASNFPFAFGSLGNDTASALAAGCPVVVKGHSAHALLAARLIAIAVAALDEAGAPHGTLSTVFGRDAGVALVSDPGIRAVGFTGSQGGGLALWRLANERPVVIPVYAEMGTVNPVVMTPGAADRREAIAEGFVGSFTLGAGQFCTKPGLLFAPAGADMGAAVADALVAAAPQPVMLTASIAESVAQGIDEMVAAGAEVVARVPGPGAGWSADAAVLTAPIAALKEESRLLEECFGAVALVVEYDTIDELVTAVRTLQGSLAAAVFGGTADPDVPGIVGVLAEQVGRVTVGDWPTGVAWTWAQHHGGPWPATSAPASTSVGAAALERFVRPVTFQSVPEAALPEAVRLPVAPGNPWRIPRRIDGRLDPL